MKALVLGGGGALGAYQAGVAYRLLQRNDYDLFVGTSVGALNAAFLSQYPSGRSKAAASDLLDLWGRSSRKDIYHHWLPFSVIHGFLPGWVPGSKPSFFDTSKGLAKFLKREVSPDKILSNGKSLLIAAHDVLNNGTRYFKGNDPDLLKVLLASSAIPGVFPPVEIRGQRFVDGGILDLVPVKGLREFPGITHADVIVCQHQSVKGVFENAIDALLYASDVIFDGAIDSDLLESNLPPENIRVFQPVNPLPSHPLNFKPKNLCRLVRLGMEDAWVTIQSMRK